MSRPACKLVVRRIKLKGRKKRKQRKVFLPEEQWDEYDLFEPRPHRFAWESEEEHQAELRRWRAKEKRWHYRWEVIVPGRRGTWVPDAKPLTVKPFSPRGWLEATRAAAGKLKADIRKGDYHDVPAVNYAVTLECPGAEPVSMATCHPSEIGDSSIYEAVCSTPHVGRRTIQAASSTPLAGW
jgi:hypothetical protein